MSAEKLIVLAVGGNSLITDPNHVTVKAQYRAAAETAEHIAALICDGHRVVIAHGNGPQVGFILRRAELARHELHMVPLDSCVADTQGAIGYNLQMALQNELRRCGCPLTAVTVVTQVVVDPKDPSFTRPAKPIGSFMDQITAEQHRDEEGWDIVEDSGRGYRRVVPSPRPLRIVELEAVRALTARSMPVITVGGGGIPVVEDSSGFLEGVEAVIDKDLAACLLAKQLHADLFIISTAVEQASLYFNTPAQQDIEKLTCRQARHYMDEGHFAPGSMLPKMEAITDFVSSTGNVGVLTDPSHLLAASLGRAGTRVVP